MNKEYGDKAVYIIGRLQKEIAFYELMFKLTQEQKNAIQKMDTDLLMGILHKKQDYMNNIDVLRRELVTVKPEWDNIKESVEGSLRNRINELSSKLSFLMRDMVNLEKENMDLAGCQQLQIKKEIGQVRVNHAGIKKYLSYGREPVRAVMDKKL